MVIFREGEGSVEVVSMLTCRRQVPMNLISAYSVFTCAAWEFGQSSGLLEACTG